LNKPELFPYKRGNAAKIFAAPDAMFDFVVCRAHYRIATEYVSPGAQSALL
jgi:hypothetical protein